MTHRAEQIMVAALANVTGLTTTGANIKRGRAYPWSDSVTRALSVYMGSDNPIDGGGFTNNAFVDRELTLVVDIHVRDAVDQIDTILNKIRAEVYTGLMTDYTQGLAFVLNTIPRGDDEPDITGEGDRPATTQRMNFGIQYRHSLTDPTS